MHISLDIFKVSTNTDNINLRVGEGFMLYDINTVPKVSMWTGNLDESTQVSSRDFSFLEFSNNTETQSFVSSYIRLVSFFFFTYYLIRNHLSIASSLSSTMRGPYTIARYKEKMVHVCGGGSITVLVQ